MGGDNGNGQLGDGTTDSSPVPVRVTGLSGVRTIAAGLESTCATLDDGSVRCWGTNMLGLLGSGGDEPESLTPVRAAGLDDAVSVSAFGAQYCALLSSRSVSCWGGDYMVYALGDEAAAAHTPQPVPGLSDAAVLTGGMFGSCAVRTGGKVACWGKNWIGLLGNGREPSLSAPDRAVVGLDDVTAIRSGGLFSCALDSAHTVSCWGLGPFGAGADSQYDLSFVAASVPGGTGITSFDTGSSHGCGVTTAGGVRCLGSGASGQLGNGTDDSSYLHAVDVDGIENATAVAAGGAHTCALLSDHTVSCWGYNGQGQLGDSTNNSSSVPVSVTVPDGQDTVLLTAVAIAAAGSSTCALLLDRTVSCWGDITSSHSPTTVTGVSDAVRITVGDGHACAILTGQTAVCWGRNGYGQLSDGSDNDSAVAVAVPEPTAITEIAAGDRGTCAIAGGEVYCWGRVAQGILGTGATPRKVAGLTGATDLAVGDLSICARLTDGTVTCWGSDFYGIGLFGDGDGPTGHGPQRVPGDVVGITGAWTGLPEPPDGPDAPDALPGTDRPAIADGPPVTIPEPPTQTRTRAPAAVALARRTLSFNGYRVQRSGRHCAKAVRVTVSSDVGRFTKVLPVIRRQGVCVIGAARITLPQWVWQRRTVKVAFSGRALVKRVIRLRRARA